VTFSFRSAGWLGDRVPGDDDEQQEAEGEHDPALAAAIRWIALGALVAFGVASALRVVLTFPGRW
jgi:hypothetical protein